MSDLEYELENGKPEEELEDPFLGDILGESEEEQEEELEDPFLGDILGGLLGEAEQEEEEEQEDPFLPFLAPLVAPLAGALPGILAGALPGLLGGLFGGDGEMENLAEQALETENEDEAEAFFGALVPTATKRLPRALLGGCSARWGKAGCPKVLRRVMQDVNKVEPNLIKNVAKIGNKLFKSPKHRGKVRTLPAIVNAAVKTIGKTVATGKPVTPAHAGKILYGKAAQVWRRPALTKKLAARCHRVAHGCQCAHARQVRVSVG